jgi:5-methylcytosine-specific restriction endonuclease McrA
MKFEEGWYILNLIGFKKMPFDYDHFGGKHLLMRSKKHQGRNARFNYQRIFTDEFDYNLHRPIKPKRDHTLIIPKLPVCERCGRTENLHREHIKPLSECGKDEPSNLRYLCDPCHKFRHAEDKIVKAIKKNQGWHLKMWQYRLEALRKLNPIGLNHYVSYWIDKDTHYEHWYQRSPKKTRPSIPSYKLEDYLTVKK